MPKPSETQRALRGVGRRIAELRRDRGFTQEKMAVQARVSWKYVQRVEAGTENLTLRSLVKFAALLGVSLAEMIEPPQELVVRPGRPRKQTCPSKKS